MLSVWIFLLAQHLMKYNKLYGYMFRLSILSHHQAFYRGCLRRNSVGQSRSRHWSLCGNWCRPLYGGQSDVNVQLPGLNTAEWSASSVALQRCSTTQTYVDGMRELRVRLDFHTYTGPKHVAIQIILF